jgi:F0F1-type ATP synthase membrane subunit b/b'
MITDLQRQLGIDGSFFTQFLIFLLIFTWLQFIFFKPFLQLILKRESQSSGLSDEAAKLEEAANRDEANYQEAIVAVRRKAMAERERLLGDARKSANDIVASAREQSKTKLEQARESTMKFAEAEINSLKGQVNSMAALLVEKLTKTKVGL